MRAKCGYGRSNGNPDDDRACHAATVAQSGGYVRWWIRAVVVACAWRWLRTVGEGGGRLNGHSVGGNGRYATVSSSDIARGHSDDASGSVAGFGGLECRSTTRGTGVRG